MTAIDDDPAGRGDMTPTSRRSVVRNAADLLLSQMATWVLATVLSVVMPRFLGPEGMGQMRLAFSVWSIVDIFATLGTSTLITLEVAKDRARGLALLGPVMKLRVATSVVGFGVVASYALATGASGQLLLIYALFGITMLAGGIGTIVRSAFIGLEHMSVPSVADVISKLVQVAIVVTALALGADVRFVVAVSAFAAIVNTSIMIRGLRRFTTLSYGGRWADGVDFARRSLVFLLGEAVGVVYLQIDIVIISFIADEKTIGWYGTADVLFASLLFAPNLLMMSLFPVFGRMHVERPDELRSLARRGFLSTLVVVTPIGIGASVVATPVAVLFFGEEFRQSGAVLSAFAVLAIPMSLNIFLGRYGLATDRQAYWVKLTIMATVLTVPLDLIFVTWTHRRFQNGAIGGGLTYIVTESIILALAIWKLLPELWSSVTLVRVAKVGVAGAALFAAAFPLRNEFILLPIIAGAVAYTLATVLLSVLDDTERAMLGKALAKLRRHQPAPLATTDGGMATPEAWIPSTDPRDHDERGAR